MIATQSRGFVDRTVFSRTELHVLFGARDEERHADVKAVEAGEIDIASIHGVEGARFHGDEIERLDIVHFSIGNVDEAGNVPAKIDQGMEFDGRFASPEFRPGKECETKIDGGGIEGVDGLIQLDGETIVSIEFASMGNEDVREVGIDSPVAILIGFGQRVACDGSSKAKVIEFGLDGIQAGFDIAQAVSVSELSERHAEELIKAGELPDAIISLVLSDAAVKIALGQGVHELREQILPGVHRQALSTVFCGKVYGLPSGDREIDTVANES